jgi:hypothetical protein
MQPTHNLPPKDLLFKLLKKDTNLIIRNYFSSGPSIWESLQNPYKSSPPLSGCPRDTAFNSEIEKPRQVPDQFDRNQTNPRSSLKRNHSLGYKRRKSAINKKTNISTYKV